MTENQINQIKIKREIIMILDLWFSIHLDYWMIQEGFCCTTRDICCVHCGESSIPRATDSNFFAGIATTTPLKRCMISSRDHDSRRSEGNVKIKKEKNQRGGRGKEKIEKTREDEKHEKKPLVSWKMATET